MADQRSTVELVFQGIDQTSEATKAALGNAQQFSQSLQSVTSPVADFSKSAVKLEASLLAAGGAIAAFAISAAGSFDDAFREISTLIEAPIEDLQEFRQAILDYANTSTQSLPAVTGAVYSAISAGVDYADSLEVVAKAEKLAVAGKADLKSAIVALEGPLNAYGASADEAGDFSDALFQAVRDGITTLPELSGSLSRVTGLAANAGIEFGELLAAVSALTATGAPTAQAVTQIQAAISNLLTPSQQARNLAEELGLEFGAAALQTKGFSGVLNEVAEATGGNIEQMGTLFGSTQALNGVLTLTGEAAGAFSDALEGQANRTGATAEAYDKMADSMTLTNQRVINALQGLLINIGDPLLEEYGNVASGIAGIFNALGAEVEEGQLGGLVELLQDILANAAEAVNSAAINLPEAFQIADLSGIEDGVRAVVTAITDLFGSFDLGTPEGLARAIEGLAQAFNILSQFSAGVISSFQLFFDFIGSGGTSSVGDFAEKWANTAGSIAGVVTQVDLLLPLLNAFLGASTTLVTILAGKQGVGIIGSAVGAAGGIKALAATLGPAGLLAAGIGFAGVQIYRLVDAFGDLREANQRAADILSEMEELAPHLADRYGEIAASTGLVVKGHEDLYAAQQQGLVVLNDATGEWEKVTDSARDYETEVKDALAEATAETGDHVDKLRQFAIETGQGFNEARGAIVSAGSDLDDLAGSAESAGDAVGYITHTAEDGSIIFTDMGQTGVKAFGDIDDKVKELSNSSEEFRLGMREIAAEEYIATIQAQTELDMARLEADTRTVEAAFDSINTSIMSTGELIGSLVGELGSVTSSGRAFNIIERQINEENRRREEALQLQKKLTEAQISALRERTRAMQSGQAMIEVDGSGLQPHLEAFMWEVLRSIQTRVNEDGLEMLLGMEAT